MTSIPKLFVSYCWSSPEHEQWVIDLATELRSSGVDVVFDKWDLREGHDAVAFMEAMVTDDKIQKVLIVSDKQYAERADGRAGGVGTETQIIGAEIYKRKSQDKFVAVVAERAPDGHPYLPTYYKSRIYVDLSQSEKYSENFEKLLRWIFDKPLYMKPDLGRPPSYIVNPDAILLGTSMLASRAVDAVRSGKSFSAGAIDEYLEKFSSELEKFRIDDPQAVDDDKVIHSIDQFIPLKNELLGFLSTLVRYDNSLERAPRIHSFLESILPYRQKPPGLNGWRDIAFDNFLFIIHEIFLNVIAVMLRSDQIEAATLILEKPYFVRDAEGSNSKLLTFREFRSHIKSLQMRNERLKLNRLSLRADLLEKRSNSSTVPFYDLMQADFVCFLRLELIGESQFYRWFPETLLYAERQYGPFEIFARSESKAYLSKILRLVGAESVDNLRALCIDFAAGTRVLPRWQFDSFNPAMLMNLDKLGTAK